MTFADGYTRWKKEKSRSNGGTALIEVRKTFDRVSIIAEANHGRKKMSLIVESG